MLRTLALAMSTSALIFLNLGKFLAALPALTSLTYSLSWNVLILASSTAAFSSSFNLLNIASGEDTLALRRKSLTALRWRSATSSSISSLDLIGTIFTRRAVPISYLVGLDVTSFFLAGSILYFRISASYSSLVFLRVVVSTIDSARVPGRPRPDCARNKVCWIWACAFCSSWVSFLRAASNLPIKVFCCAAALAARCWAADFSLVFANLLASFSNSRKAATSFLMSASKVAHWVATRSDIVALRTLLVVLPATSQEPLCTGTCIFLRCSAVALSQAAFSFLYASTSLGSLLLTHLYLKPLTTTSS